MPRTDKRLKKEERDDDCAEDNMALRVVVDLVKEESVMISRVVHTTLGLRKQR
jgi:hypothetical protein